MEKNSDFFLELDGIKGESTDDDFSEQIEIDSYQVSATNPPDLTSATGGAGAGRVSHGGMHLTFQTSAATAHLFSKCCVGTHIEKAVLTLRKAGGSQQVYHKITMTEVYIAAHQMSGSTSVINSSDCMTLAYGTITHEYFKQDANGQTKSAGPKTWNLRTNKAS